MAKFQPSTPEQVTFEKARKLYPGAKRGFDKEFVNFKKKHRDWREVLPLLEPAIQNQIRWRETANGEFRPPWKNFPTWINSGWWEFEPEVELKKKSRLCACGCGKETNFTYGNKHYFSSDHRNRMEGE